MKLRPWREVADLRKTQTAIEPYIAPDDAATIGRLLRRLERHYPAPGSDRTKRLRKKRAKADGSWWRGRGDVVHARNEGGVSCYLDVLEASALVMADFAAGVPAGVKLEDDPWR